MPHPKFQMRRFTLRMRRVRGVLAQSKRAAWLSDSSPLRSKDALCLPTLCGSTERRKWV